MSINKGRYALIILLLAGGFAVSPRGEEGDIRLNDLLPETTRKWLEMGVQFRHRFEYVSNFDFDDASDDEDGFHLLRTRFDLKLSPHRNVGVFLQLQDSRILDESSTATGPYQNSLDIHQAYVEVKGIAGDHFRFRVGRQVLAYADQRLVGGFDWSNLAQSFDAAKATVHTRRLDVDFFAARRVLKKDGEWDKWDNEDDLYGLWSTLRVSADHELNAFYFYRDTDRPIGFGPNVGAAVLSESTLGFRFTGKQQGFDYHLQAAYQFGDFGGQDIRAHAVIAEAGYTFPVSWTPRVAGVWSLGSGDRNPLDNERNTFDNLFPTNHLYYGYMDRASLQNLNNFRLMITIAPFKGFSVEGDIHFLRLDETTDSLYNAGRVAYRTAASAGVSDYVGIDFDLLFKYRWNGNIAVLGGISHFYTRDFLRETGPADDGKYFYLQTVITF